MTSTPTAPGDVTSVPPGPPPYTLTAAAALVTRYRLRLTDAADTRLGELGGDQYVLGAASWTGRIAAFTGFYVPPVTGALEDCERRVRAAECWAAERLRQQGLSGAERCSVLLVALGPVPGRVAPAADAPGHVGVAALDMATGTVDVVAPLPPGLPGAGELRGYWKASRDPAAVPTLAAVDLMERETVRGGRVAPTRRALDTGPQATYWLIAAFAAVYVLELAVKGHFTNSLGQIDLVGAGGFYESFGALVNAPPGDRDWWRYVTSAFVHDAGGANSIGVLHILGNSFGLFVLGRPIEQLFGRIALVATFLVTAVGGGLFWVLFHALGIAGLGIGYGASGGVFGLIGLILMLGRVQGRDLPAGLVAALRQYATGLLVYNAIFLVFFGGALGINNFAHAGGLFSGVLVGCVLPPRAAIGGREQRRVEQVVMVAVIAIAVAALAVGGHELSSALTASAPASPPQTLPLS